VLALNEPCRGAFVVLIDDNPDLAQLIGALLAESGMSARIVGWEGGAAALDEAYFDLVLSDVKMPEMDGLELLERMRAGYPDR
jgi:CheY-like chemotaxis protein